MVNLAINLLKMHWLGTYNTYTLIKGSFFPMFLAFNCFIGLSYIDALTLLYSFSCIFFLYIISKIFENNSRKYFYLIFIFIFLLLILLHILGKHYNVFIKWNYYVSSDNVI